MKKLYKHQQKFIEKNPDRAMLVWETGTGKTIAACEWIKKRHNMKILVACPKAIIEKWKRDLKEWGAKADVVSRDEIKKIYLPKYQGIVLDEAQDFLSPAFTKQRSERTTVIYNYLRGITSAHVLLLTATPIRSTAWNCHTAGCFLGLLWPVQAFRNKFFYMTDMFGRYHYEPTKTWRKDIRPYLESISDIVLAKDVAEIPTQEHEVVKIPWTKKQEEELKKQYLEPAAEFHERRRAEQSEAKWAKLKELLSGYRKVILVVYYRNQIEDYVDRIGQDRAVFILHGGINNQDEVIEQAKASDDCIFIMQSSMGAGFDASEFSVMIFASMSFKYTDYIQSLGRINRINNLHKNKYIYLLGGKTDQDVYDTILSGNDFNPHKYLIQYTDEERIQRKRVTNPEHTDEYITSSPTDDKEKRSIGYTKSSRMVSRQSPF